MCYMTIFYIKKKKGMQDTGKLQKIMKEKNSATIMFYCLVEIDAADRVKCTDFCVTI